MIRKLVNNNTLNWIVRIDAMAHILINEARCKGCGLCTIACPKNLITLEDTPNSLGYTLAVFSNPEKCTGCALCAQMCPDVAIIVFREE